MCCVLWYEGLMLSEPSSVMSGIVEPVQVAQFSSQPGEKKISFREPRKHVETIKGCVTQRNMSGMQFIWALPKSALNPYE